MKIVKRLRDRNRLLRALSGVAFIWLLLDRDDSPAQTIHRTFCASCWRDADFLGGIGLAAGLTVFLPALVVTASVYTWRCGRCVYRQTGVRPWAQFVGQITLGVKLAVPPPWYYVFEFYRREQRRQAGEYLYFIELKRALYHDLRRRWSSRETLAALSDKALFPDYCQRHNLAVIPVLAVAEQGRVAMMNADDSLPAKDLFFKPRKGAGGHGAACWYYRGGGLYESNELERRTAESLGKALAEKSRTGAYIVRPLVTNHPAFAEINAGALSTVRVMTCLDPAGGVACTHAALRMASAPGSPVDNFHRGGIAAAVEMTTGTLGRATDIGWSGDSAWHTHHPTTGAAIAGFGLPFWAETVELARRAHAAFADQVLVGWDIAILADGPVLVEGNKGADLDIIQRVYREPVGNTRIGQSLAYYLTCSADGFKHASVEGGA